MKLNYPGVPVYFNGQNYFIPSLSTRDFKANYETLTAPAPENRDGDRCLRSFHPDHRAGSSPELSGRVG